MDDFLRFNQPGKFDIQFHETVKICIQKFIMKYSCKQT